MDGAFKSGKPESESEELGSIRCKEEIAEELLKIFSKPVAREGAWRGRRGPDLEGFEHHPRHTWEPWKGGEQGSDDQSSISEDHAGCGVKNGWREGRVETVDRRLLRKSRKGREMGRSKTLGREWRQVNSSKNCSRNRIRKKDSFRHKRQGVST